MDRFSLFFAFYSLILGLAITEILSGFGSFVRSHTTHKLGAQTALLALLTFVSITATWIDSFSTLRAIDLSVESLWAPILTATAYYLAAVVVFPSNATDFDHLDIYFADHKRFVVAMLFCAELLVTFTFIPLIEQNTHDHPRSALLFYLPYTVALKGSYVGLFFARSRTANIAWLSFLIFLLVFFYWDNGTIAQMIDAHAAR